MYVVSRTTSSLLVDLFVIALVSFLLHHHLRASSTGKIPRGLEFANYVLISIYVIADITWGITSVDYVKKSRLCRYCYEDCAAYCNRYSLHSLYNRSAIVAITLDALYALLGGYWLALAIIALKRGQSINLRSSVRGIFCTNSSLRNERRRQANSLHSKLCIAEIFPHPCPCHSPSHFLRILCRDLRRSSRLFHLKRDRCRIYWI